MGQTNVGDVLTSGDKEIQRSVKKTGFDFACTLLREGSKQYNASAGVWLVTRLLTVARQPVILTRFPFKRADKISQHRNIINGRTKTKV